MITLLLSDLVFGMLYYIDPNPKDNPNPNPNPSPNHIYSGTDFPTIIPEDLSHGHLLVSSMR